VDAGVCVSLPWVTCLDTLRLNAPARVGLDLARGTSTTTTASHGRHAHHLLGYAVGFLLKGIAGTIQTQFGLHAEPRLKMRSVLRWLYEDALL
jgi:hypothetical protein